MAGEQLVDRLKAIWQTRASPGAIAARSAGDGGPVRAGQHPGPATAGSIRCTGFLVACLLTWSIACAEPVAADRSPAVRAEFRKLHPCPATGKKTGACPGWQIDHRQALVCGGVDELANLQWLRTEEHREKTRAEVKLCRTNKHTKGKH